MLTGVTMNCPICGKPVGKDCIQARPYGEELPDGLISYKGIHKECLGGFTIKEGKHTVMVYAIARKVQR